MVNNPKRLTKEDLVSWMHNSVSPDYGEVLREDCIDIGEIGKQILKNQEIVERLQSKLHEDDCLCGICPMFREILR